MHCATLQTITPTLTKYREKTRLVKLHITDVRAGIFFSWVLSFLYIQDVRDTLNDVVAEP
jgi:hypothetical protein